MLPGPFCASVTPSTSDPATTAAPAESDGATTTVGVATRLLADVSAEAGSVTSMVGGAPSDVQEALPIIQCWSKKVVHCGPVGAGDATKSINNVLNSAHLLLATEGSESQSYKL